MTVATFFKQLISKDEAPRTGVQCVRCERWASEFMFEGLCEQCVMCESFAYPKTLCNRCKAQGKREAKANAKAPAVYIDPQQWAAGKECKHE